MIKLLKLSVTESSLAQRDELYEINYLVVHYNKLLHCYTQTHTHTHTYIYIYIYIYTVYIYIYILQLSVLHQHIKPSECLSL